MRYLFTQLKTHLPLFLIGAAVLVGGAGLWLAAPASAEWREPSQPPPQQTFPAPLTTSDLNQTKPGRLLIDPSYNPTEESSLNFSANRSLEVRGTGAEFDTPYTYTDLLRVDTDTLYVTGADQWVGIGTDTPEAGYALVVRGGTTQVGTSTNPFTGVPVRSYTTDAVALYGDGGSTGDAGVYGLNAQNTGWAVRGESAEHVGVQGESPSGIGIYASTQSASNAAVYAENTNEGWAGYFQGRLGAGGDIIAERFLQTYVGSSLEKFAQPRVVYNAQISNTYDSGSFFVPRLVFDGTYVWITNKSEDHSGSNLFKVRAADGELIDQYHVEGVDATPHDIVFDGEFIWMTSTGLGDNSLLKFDPDVGQVVARCSTVDPDRPSGATWGESPNDLIVTSEAGDIYIWTANADGGDLTKFDQQCNQVGVYPIGEGGTDAYLNRLNAAGYMMQPYDIEYSNGSVWTLTPNVCSTAAPDTTSMCFDTSTCSSGSCIENGSNLVEIDPTTGDVLNRYATGVPDAWKMVSDGYYMWVISRPSVQGEQRVSKVRISDGQIMTAEYPLVLSNAPRDISFDGSHVWIVSSNALLRINVATDDRTTVASGLQTNYWDNGSVFDGNHLWVAAACTSSDPVSCTAGSGKPLWISKVAINQNTGQPDFGSVVQLRRNPGFCSVTTTQQCVYDWHCPASETCDSGYGKQTGHINISESLTISHGHCYAGGTHYYNRTCTSNAACSDISGAVCTGGNLRVDGDIDSAGNQWSGDEVIVDVSTGIADCPDDGTFMTGAVVDSSHEIVQIICRGL